MGYSLVAISMMILYCLALIYREIFSKVLPPGSRPLAPTPRPVLQVPRASSLAPRAGVQLDSTILS